MWGVIVCAVAVALIQVPWIPCHCAGNGACVPRPTLGAAVHDCEAHRARPEPARCACSHHHHDAHHDHAHHAHHDEPPVDAPRPGDDTDDHDHDLLFLQAVAPGTGVTLASHAPALDAIPLALDAPSALPVRSVRSQMSPPDIGPPSRLASVRLLL